MSCWNFFSSRDLKDEESHLKACCIKYPIKKNKKNKITTTTLPSGAMFAPLAYFLLFFSNIPNRSSQSKIQNTKYKTKKRKKKIHSMNLWFMDSRSLLIFDRKTYNNNNNNNKNLLEKIIREWKIKIKIIFPV